MIQAENFIYFFTSCGFFIGLTFCVINFILPEEILLYTAEITLFFYLFSHVMVMNFVDIKKFGARLFDKRKYEEISDYFIHELDFREKRMDNLLLEVDKMNKEFKQLEESSKEEKGAKHKKAA